MSHGKILHGDAAYGCTLAPTPSSCGVTLKRPTAPTHPWRYQAACLFRRAQTPQLLGNSKGVKAKDMRENMGGTQLRLPTSKAQLSLQHFLGSQSGPPFKRPSVCEVAAQQCRSGPLLLPLMGRKIYLLPNCQQSNKRICFHKKDPRLSFCSRLFQSVAVAATDFTTELREGRPLRHLCNCWTTGVLST